jgi:tetratricopeptide (TPR) repeat protein
MDTDNRYGGRSFCRVNAFKVIVLIFSGWMCFSWSCVWAAEQSEQEIAEQLQLAQRCRENEQYEAAEEILRALLAQELDTRETGEVQKHLIVLYVAWGHTDQAQAAYNALPLEGDLRNEAVQATDEAAYYYLQQGNHQKALPIYQYIVDEWSRRENAIWLAATETIFLIYAGEDPNTDAILSELTTNYSGHQDLAKAVNKIGDNYYDMQKYPQAIELYRYVVENQVESDYALWSQTSLVACYLDQGDEPFTRKEMAQLLETFSERHDLNEAVGILMREFWTAKKYEYVRDYQQYILDNQIPQLDALQAQGEVAAANVKLGDDKGVEAALKKLKTNYSAPEKQAEALKKVGDHCREMKKYTRAQELYQYIAEHWPQTASAIWSLKDLAVCQIQTGEFSAAEATLQKIQNDFVGQAELAKAVFEAAWAWGEKDAGQAALVCRSILTNHPEHDYALFAEAYLGILEVRRGNVTGAEAIFETLIVRYRDHYKLPETILMIADSYQSQSYRLEKEGHNALADDYRRRALAKWNIITSNPSEDDYISALAHKLSGDIHRRLGEYEKGIEHYQIVVANWPKFQYAWHAQFLVGRCYEQMKQAGTISVSEADDQIRTAYEQLLQNYPKSPSVEAALRWLNR